MISRTSLALSLFFLAQYCSCLSQHSNVIEIYSMQEAQEVLDHADSNTLVLYDIGKTLVIPIDVLIRNTGRASGEMEYLWSKVLLQAKLRVMEPAIIDTIKDLHKRGIITMGFTKRASGKYGVIPSLAECWFNMLMELGIEFYQGHGTVEFTQFARKFDGYPMLYRGIIITNEITKGPILGALLDHLTYRPSQVIFFDDSLENIVSVKRELLTRGISYYGFHYRASENITLEIDKSVVQLQLDYLAKHEIWLSDAQARELLIHELPSTKRLQITDATELRPEKEVARKSEN